MNGADADRAIRELVARYAVELDAGRAERVASLFAEDAVFDTDTIARRAEGRGAIEALFRAAIEERGPSIHVTHHHLIAPDGGPAARTGLADVTAYLNREGDGCRLELRYLDRYILDGEEWLFRERHVIQRLLHTERGAPWSFSGTTPQGDALTIFEKIRGEAGAIDE